MTHVCIFNGDNTGYTGVYLADPPTLHIYPEPDAIRHDTELTVFTFLPINRARDRGGRTSPVLDYVATATGITDVLIEPSYFSEGFVEFTAILGTNQSYTQLVLNFKLTGNDLIHLARALRANRTLKEFTLFLDRDTPLWWLKPVLSRHPSLLALTFTGYLSTAVHTTIVAIVSANTRLATIDLRAEPIMHQTYAELMTVISTHLHRNRDLRAAFFCLMLCLHRTNKGLPDEILQLLYSYTF